MTTTPAKKLTAKEAMLGQRRAGVLAHITSLPGPLGNGDFSHDAYRFVEFCAASGFSIWQVLPLNPTHADGSPYFSLSANAGNPLLISLDWLVDRGWLGGVDPSITAAEAPAYRQASLRIAYKSFAVDADAAWKKRHKTFCERNAAWLDDYAAFTAFNALHDGAAWTDWSPVLRDRSGAAYEQALADHADAMNQVRFEQFVFFAQWNDLRAYAHRNGVYLFGDLPIFVAHHSADVWSHRGLWQLDRAGQPTVVAGVPPDYFSETGQVWGNPLYRWAAHRKDDFAWWLTRLKTQRELFDLLRIDHFRGLEACWEIQAGETTAIDGKWVKTPGDELLSAVQLHLGDLPLVAEDLGEITPEVEALRKQFAMPGMRVMQFGFGGGPDNLHLPHNFATDFVAYTGTHDNAVTLEWYEALTAAEKDEVARYLPTSRVDMPDAMIEAVYASVARLAVIPMQDVLALGEGNRMNTPGTMGEENWRWRFEWSQLKDARKADLKELARLYNRL
ncbi:4-alpha-glucanotransferase [Hydrocarboniphaga sp.]|uniref:4-alpha-glucanotransferase n=1 Tax=Hydrocarboniphaga sp. TaxID=2033016 RepID=UPI003D10F6A0